MDNRMAMFVRITHGYTQACLAAGLILKKNVAVYSKSKIEAGQTTSGMYMRTEGDQAVVKFDQEERVPVSDLILAAALKEANAHVSFERGEQEAMDMMIEYSTQPDGHGMGCILPGQFWENDR